MIKKIQAKLDVEIYKGMFAAAEFQKKIDELTHENEKLISDLAASESSQGMLRRKIRAMITPEEERAEWDVDQELAQWTEKYPHMEFTVANIVAKAAAMHKGTLVIDEEPPEDSEEQKEEEPKVGDEAVSCAAQIPVPSFKTIPEEQVKEVV